MSVKSNSYCSVPRCNSWIKTNPNLSFHRFPESGKYRVSIQKNTEEFELVDVRQAWIIKSKIARPVSKFMKVCSEHFKEDDYMPRDLTGRKKLRFLKKIAVPSLKLPVTNDDITLLSTSESASNSKKLVSQNLKKYEYIQCNGEDTPEVVQYSLQDVDAANVLLQLKRLNSESVSRRLEEDSPQGNPSKNKNLPSSRLETC